ncbi:MAG TPA: TonB-dependent receptor [Bacteroidales bacterium]|nr:TonB-dependent receptor [Bacteroidales bacterium]
MNSVRFRRFFIGILLLFVVFTANAQKGSIKGFVYDKETGEPALFTSVYLYKTTIGATTDINGFFAITQIPPGDYILMATFIGYDTVRMPVTVNKGDNINKKLYLQRQAIEMDVINIVGEEVDKKTETNVSKDVVNIEKIERIPAVGGQADLAQYLQVLPGVVFTGDQGGQLYIRGGSPVQNKVLLDGMIVYNPFHSIGLFSVFDTDILKNADVYTGGFGAEYGGRISSVMDITTRDGNKKRISGKIDASTFGAKLLLEGPIVKQKQDDKANSSFIFSVKNSYLKQSSKLLYTYIDTAGLPFNYMDLYGKISVNAPNGSKVNFYGYRFADKADYRQIATFKWNSYGAGTNFVVIPGKASMLIEGAFAYSRYGISLNSSTDTSASTINGFNMGLNFTSFFGKSELRYGIEVLGFGTNLEFYNSANRLIYQKESTTEFALFLKYKWVIGKFLIEPSIRAHEYASLSTFSPEPRLAVKYNVTKILRLKLAAGMYSQNLISSSSDRDVVNLFYGFISGPDNLQDEFDGKLVTHALQKADHVIFGVEVDILKNLTFNVEGYYKWFTQLSNINRNKVYEDSPDYASKPDVLKKDFIIEKGDAEGVDFTIKYEHKHKDKNVKKNRQLYLWAVYSYGFIHRYDGYTTYFPHYDRRHNVNLVGSVNFGKNFSWGVNVRWNLGSGFPFAQTQGFYELLDFADGINTDYTTNNGTMGIIYAEYDSGRLPFYHRLDVSFNKVFEFGENMKLDINLGLTNVYNRKNIFYFDRITYQRIDQLPIMPSLGVSFKF